MECPHALLFRAFYFEITVLLPKYQKYLSVFFNSPAGKSISIQLHPLKEFLFKITWVAENLSHLLGRSEHISGIPRYKKAT